MSRGAFPARDNAKVSRARRRDEASRWFVLLQHADLSPRVLGAWKKWEAVPENRDAFDVVVHLWGTLNAIAPPPEPSLKEGGDDQYDGSVPVITWLAASTKGKMRALQRRIVVFTLGSAAAALIAAVGLRWAHLQDIQPSIGDEAVSAETNIAEHKDVVLVDGSRIRLGAQTLVTAHFTEHVRLVVLHRGEALFDVARDPRRPFHVNAGKGDVKAVGTAFHVLRRADNQIVVTVTHGVVDVSPSYVIQKSPELSLKSDAAKSGSAQRLIQGQEIRVGPDGRLSPVRAADLSTSGGWRDGRLTYRGEPLRNVLEDVNRYSHRQVILGDGEAGDLLYSGTVFERQIDDWLAVLDKIYPELEVVTTDGRHVLIRIRQSTRL